MGGVVCLREDDNPYISSIVGFFLSIDKEMVWGNNFSNYGAKNHDKINTMEIFVSTTLLNCFVTSTFVPIFPGTQEENPDIQVKML